MTMSPIVRVRVLGLLVVAVAFIAGVATGIAIDRRPRQGMNVMVTATATDAMPRELERLGLTEPQRGEIRTILVRGRDRVFTVLRDFEPRMGRVMDSTNIEIDAVLTEAQRASLAEYRRTHRAVVDTQIKKTGNRE